MSLKQDECRELCSPKVLDNVKPAWLLAFISTLPTVVTLEYLKTQNSIAFVLEPVLSGNLCQISDTCISLLAWEMELWKMCLHRQTTPSLQEHYMALVNWVLCSWQYKSNQVLLKEQRVMMTLLSQCFLKGGNVYDVVTWTWTWSNTSWCVILCPFFSCELRQTTKPWRTRFFVLL